MYWPSIPGVLRLVLVGLLVCGLPARQGDPASSLRGSWRHTAESARNTSIVLSTVAVLIAADVLRLLWVGGVVLRGKRRQRVISLDSGVEAVLDTVELRAWEGLLARAEVLRSECHRVTVSFALRAPEEPRVEASRTAVVPHRDANTLVRARWESVGEPSGRVILVPPRGWRTWSLICKAQGSSGPVQLIIRWWPTLAWKRLWTG